MRPLHQTQRLMRNMRRAAIQRGVAAILDVGTSKLACFVLRFDGPEGGSQAEGVGPMAGQSSVRVIGASHTRSRGVRFGEVAAAAETERAIRTAVQAAQKQAGVRVDHVIACFSGARPESFGLSGEAEVEGAVTGLDVGRVLASCEMPSLGPGREVLHAQPVNFALDHRSGLADPRGQIGRSLAADVHLLAVDAPPSRRSSTASGVATSSAQGWPPRPTCRASPRSWRTSRSWARPASTWGRARRGCRSSSAST